MTIHISEAHNSGTRDVFDGDKHIGFLAKTDKRWWVALPNRGRHTVHKLRRDAIAALVGQQP